MTIQGINLLGGDTTHINFGSMKAEDTKGPGRDKKASDSENDVMGLLSNLLNLMTELLKSLNNEKGKGGAGKGEGEGKCDDNENSPNSDVVDVLKSASKFLDESAKMISKNGK